ncbi:MAG: hypothetical protein EBS41_00925 [Actinobacteria bacterium]|jgi:hypothetical protein|nr:hypothetical protein [Actinomycetota bacterium]
MGFLFAYVNNMAATVLMSVAQTDAPSPQPNINNDTVQAGPTPLLMIGGLLIVVVLLALSMRRHLRRVPKDLDVVTRSGGKTRDDIADAPAAAE